MRGKPNSSLRQRRAYGRISRAAKRELYEGWAPSYDRELLSDLGYVGPVTAVEAFVRRVPDRGARVLDAGCGTGLVGRALHRRGYRNLHGVDFSPAMLERAALTNAYVSLAEADLTRRLDVDTDYDAAISVGVFGFGPPHAEHLSHLCGAVKALAPVLITINGRGWVERGWQEALPRELLKHGLVLEELTEIDYLTAQGIPAMLAVLHRTSRL